MGRTPRPPVAMMQASQAFILLFASTGTLLIDLATARRIIRVRSHSDDRGPLSRSPFHLWPTIRGGSTTTTIATIATTQQTSSSSSSSSDTVDPIAYYTSKERAYRLQQQLYLQSRSIQLREALIGRGLVELQHYDATGTATTTTTTRPKDNVDWDCLLSTENSPKQCLFTFATEVGTKLLCPVGTTNQYITVKYLNHLRRTDPTKVNMLWNNQYNVLEAWFGEESPYSVYRHLPPPFALAVSALLLDRPWLLQTLLGLGSIFAVVVTLPAWRILVPQLLQIPLLWDTWSHWGRFLHAALPLKLLMVQYALYYIGTAAKFIYMEIRDYLVAWECQMLQECLPLTILQDEDVQEQEKESSQDFTTS